MNVHREVLKKLRKKFPNLGIENSIVRTPKLPNTLSGGVKFLGEEFYYIFYVDNPNLNFPVEWKSLAIDRVIYAITNKIEEYFEIRYHHPIVKELYFLNDNQLDWVEDYLIMTDWEQIYRKLPEIEN